MSRHSSAANRGLLLGAAVAFAVVLLLSPTDSAEAARRREICCCEQFQPEVCGWHTFAPNEQCETIGLVTATVDRCRAFAVSSEEPSQPPITFTPQVPIPGFAGGTVTGTTFGAYIRAFYIYFIGIVGILAVIMIMYGGYQWLSAAGNSSRIQSAQTTMNGAVVGLVLALTSFLLLRLINPSLVRFTNITALTLQRHEQGAFEDGHNPVSCPKQSELRRIFGNPEDQVEFRLETVPYTHPPGSPQFGITNYRFHEKIAQRVRAVFNEIQQYTYYDIANPPDESYAKRNSTFNRECWSLHAFGLAIDINPLQNPACPKGTPCYDNPENNNDIPQKVKEAFIKNGFEWGGNWNSVHDYMHFQLSGAAIAELGQAMEQ